jgi:hypothetical protein
MLGYIICGNLIRDPLKAEIIDQAVEQGGGVVPLNCGTQGWVPKLFQ